MAFMMRAFSAEAFLIRNSWRDAPG